MLEALRRLPDLFRANAADVRRLAAGEGAALVWEKAGGVLEAEIERAVMEPLPLHHAEMESGYTRGHLRRMLRDNIIPNVGTLQDPRILRKHLPRKPGFGVDQPPVQPASSRMQAARAVIEGDD